MRIAMHVKVSGGRGDGTQWPDPNNPFEVDDAEGTQLCAGGLAYPVAEERKAEKAVAPDDTEKRAGARATARKPG